MMPTPRWIARCVAACLFAFAAWGAPPKAPPEPPGVKEGRLTGTVKQRLEAPGYTYLLLATSAGEQWAAVPQSAAKPGDQATVFVQALMGGFESKSLNRTFERIFFGTTDPGAAAPPPALPAGHPTRAAAPLKAASAAGRITGPAPRSSTGIEGTVKEVLQVPGYTYLRLETATGETWAAVPTTKLKLGSRARIETPAPMDGFVSKTLNRTFQRIVFGSLGEVTDAPR